MLSRTGRQAKQGNAEMSYSDDRDDILYADSALLVAAKPSGLLAVPGRGDDKHDCLASRVQARFPDALVVHRLDMATSGLMLMAIGKVVQRRLDRMFRERRVDKRYVAVVAGRVWPTAGEIDLPLAADWPNRPRQRVDRLSGRPSLTTYRVLAGDEERTRLELTPHSGRTHQLRVHLAAIGHPIVGDSLYASPEIAAGSPRLLLHAAYLSFAHPLHGAKLTFASVAPF